MKKRYIFITIIILLIIGFSTFIIIDFNDFSSSTSSKIINSIKNKDDVLLYITDNDKSYDNFIDYYIKTYNININKLDNSKEKDKHYKILVNKLGINKTNYPVFIIAKNGKIIKNSIKKLNDNVFANMLLDNGFIDKIIDNPIITDDTFDELNNSSGKHLILSLSYSNNNFEIKKKMTELSSQYKFDYNILYYSDMSENTYNKLVNKIDTVFLANTLLILENDEVIDYIKIAINDEEIDSDLLDFIKRNNIIK